MRLPYERVTKYIQTQEGNYSCNVRDNRIGYTEKGEIAGDITPYAVVVPHQGESHRGAKGTTRLV